MNVSLTAQVYSVVTCKYDDVARVDAFLYEHTDIVGMPGYDIADKVGMNGQRVPVVLVTSSRTEVPVGSEAAAIGALAYQAFNNAQNQLDRLASGLLMGNVAGSFTEAVGAALEIITF